MKLGVLASHEGSTLQAILDAIADGRLAAPVAIVISNNRESGALRRALAASVPAVHLASGASETGVSIHFVDAEYDTGRVLAQCLVPVMPGDSAADLASRVQAREKGFVVETLAKLAETLKREEAG